MKNKVTALAGDRTEDAIAKVSEYVDAGAQGILVAVVDGSGSMWWRYWGDVNCGNMALLGLSLTKEALGTAEDV